MSRPVSIRTQVKCEIYWDWSSMYMVKQHKVVWDTSVYYKMKLTWVRRMTLHEIKDDSYIPVTVNCINQANIEISSIWLNIIRKYVTNINCGGDRNMILFVCLHVDPTQTVDPLSSNLAEYDLMDCYVWIVEVMCNEFHVFMYSLSFFVELIFSGTLTFST